MEVNFNTKDNDLIALIKKGKGQSKSQAEKVLYVRYRRFFTHYLRHSKDFELKYVEEAVSVSLTKVFEKIDQFDPKKAKFTTWAHRIAHNTMVDHLRKAMPVFRPIHDYFVFDPPSKAVIADRQYIFKEFSELLWECAQKYLSEKAFKIFKFRADGWSYEAISKRLNVNMVTLRVIHLRSKKTLEPIREYYYPTC